MDIKKTKLELMEESVEEEIEEELEEEKVEQEELNEKEIDKEIYKEAKSMELIAEEDLKEDISVYAGYVGNDPVRSYFATICNYPLLSSEEERELYPYIDARTEALNKLEEFNNATINLTDKQVDKLYKDIENASWAREKLINHNLRLVAFIAKKYFTFVNNLEFLDLIQEGNLGLMKALDKFESKYEVKFSTYAHWWVRQSITRAIGDTDKLIRIPIHVVEQINSYLREKSKLVSVIGEPTTIDMLNRVYYPEWLEQFKKEKIKEFEKLGISYTDKMLEPTKEEEKEAKKKLLHKIDGFEKYILSPLSLDSKLASFKSEDNDSVLGDFVEDQSIERPDEIAYKEGVKQELNNILDTVLNERQREIVKYRFGLTDGQCHTLEDVGNMFNVTRERIRQIESQALILLRRNERCKELFKYLMD